MKQLLIAIFCILFGATSPALADPVTDAAYITDQHMRAADYPGKIATLSQEILPNMQSAFQGLGATIIDPDQFVDVLVGGFYKDLMPEFRQASISAYLEFLSYEELATLADFYRSDPGQALLDQGLTPDTLGDATAILNRTTGSPLFARLPELVAQMDDTILAASVRLDDVFSMDRMADIMEMRTIVSFESEHRRQAVIEALRKAD